MLVRIRGGSMNQEPPPIFNEAQYTFLYYNTCRLLD